MFDLAAGIRRLIRLDAMRGGCEAHASLQNLAPYRITDAPSRDIAIGIPGIGIRIERPGAIAHTLIPIATGDRAAPRNVIHLTQASKPALSHRAFLLARILDSPAPVMRHSPYLAQRAALGKGRTRCTHDVPHKARRDEFSFSAYPQ